MDAKGVDEHFKIKEEGEENLMPSIQILKPYALLFLFPYK